MIPLLLHGQVPWAVQLLCWYRAKNLAFGLIKTNSGPGSELTFIDAKELLGQSQGWSVFFFFFIFFPLSGIAFLNL